MKAFIFDLDGVLVDTCDLHCHAFLTALSEVTKIHMDVEEHNRLLNGLSTREKLSKLGVDINTSDAVFTLKQNLTKTMLLQKCSPSERLQTTMMGLRSRGIKIACASNCIRESVETVLHALGIRELFDAVLSNEDVRNPKPSPEIYTNAMERLQVSPQDTLIFEDSQVGLRAAIASHAWVHCVRSPFDITLEYCLSAKPNV